MKKQYWVTATLCLLLVISLGVNILQFCARKELLSRDEQLEEVVKESKSAFEMRKDNLMELLRLDDPGLDFLQQAVQFRMAVVFGERCAAASGIDPGWIYVSAAMVELKNPDVYACLSREDRDEILRFLEKYEYSPDPSIPEEEYMRIAELVDQARVACVTASGTDSEQNTEG